MLEKVSLITPTYAREQFLPLLYQIITRQDYPNLEWLVFDDSPRPSPFLEALSDPRVHYFHQPERLSIGEKRNRLIEASQGSIIAHFDDDDYYSPNYLSAMLARLQPDVDFVKLSGWFVYTVNHAHFGYWDLCRREGIHHVFAKAPLQVVNVNLADNEQVDLPLGFGFSYVYRKQVWQQAAFQAINWGEDIPFALQAQQNFKLRYFPDEEGLCCHVLHQHNTSRCYPQYVLPPFMLRHFFGESIEQLLEL